MRKISHQQAAFFRYELERGNAETKKRALQDLCSLYRTGHFLPIELLEGFEALIDGILLQQDQDLKVVRWCLNALAQLGRFANSSYYVEVALRKFAGDPEIEAAGVAALCHMHRGKIDGISSLAGIDPVTWKLAALQNTPPKNIDLTGLTINIENAEAPVLRLALITAGLNRDIENLFHPKHSNAVFVKRLGQHPDNVVQQYSVWAVMENHRLTFDDLGVPLDKIDTLPTNVQAKVYQLVAERDPDPHRRLEITAQGSETAQDYAREGLARGVKAHFYDGLETVTLDWYRQEKNRVVRGHLAEHFARFSDQCSPYEDRALQIFEEDESLQDRLILGAERKPLYGKLRAVRAPELFDNSSNPTGIPVHLIGPVTNRAKKRVLFLAASPLNSPRIRPEEEQREIKKNVQLVTSPKLDLDFMFEPATRVKDIVTSVLSSDAEVFHFSGHGESDGLIFESDEGLGKKVGGEVLATHLTSISRTLECVVLNACFSDGLAMALQKNVEVLIGCNSEILDEAAICFSRAFYAAMAAGKTYRECFDIAVNDVRGNHSDQEAQKYVIRFGTS